MMVFVRTEVKKKEKKRSKKERKENKQKEKKQDGEKMAAIICKRHLLEKERDVVMSPGKLALKTSGNGRINAR